MSPAWTQHIGRPGDERSTTERRLASFVLAVRARSDMGFGAATSLAANA